MEKLYSFFLEMDKLKSVYRRTYISDLSRKENSAEHSWHLAIAIMTLKEELHLDLDVLKAVKMALIHDVCEVGAGDISIFHPDRDKVEAHERAYLKNLSETDLIITSEIKELWEEYEAQQTRESHWVKVVDRFLPFMLNFSAEGKTWLEQGIKKSQVIEINSVIKDKAPEIYKWILAKIDIAVEKGWLIQD